MSSHLYQDWLEWRDAQPDNPTIILSIPDCQYCYVKKKPSANGPFATGISSFCESCLPKVSTISNLMKAWRGVAEWDQLVLVWQTNRAWMCK